MMRRAKTPDLDKLRQAPGREKLSVIITTFNEEVNIADCIESVAWADEILVVDSFSTDRTVEVAKRYPVRLLQREYYGSAAQKNWAIDRVEHGWVLIVDADERVTVPLAAEILVLLTRSPQVDGYYIRRENVFIDRVMRHSGWSTDKVIRLFRRDKGRYPNRRVHADLAIEGPTPELDHPFLHYTFRSFGQYFDKFLNYAEWGAAQAFREGRTVGVLEIAGRPFWRFFRTYFLQLGFLDGLHGLVLCTLQSFGVFLKYARLWEYRLRTRRGEVIKLPAFDEDPRTWQRQEGEDGGDPETGHPLGAPGETAPREGGGR
jgi:glycosyltransferase involved in cell wall biosynthesis